MAANKLPWATKIQGKSNPKPANEKLTFTEINELVVDFNANADIIDQNEADAAAAQATADAALPKAGGAMSGAITGDQSARLYRPVGTDITSSTNTASMQNNTFFDVDSSSGAVTITLSSLATSAEGNAEWELFVADATNTITVLTDSGVTALASGDISLAASESMTIGAAGDAMVIKLKADDTYRVVGGTFTKV